MLEEADGAIPSRPGERERERDHGLEMLWYQSIVALVN